MDRLIRRALDDQSSSGQSSACLDAATLAAWADGALSGPERTALEAHAAGCARCQAMLAAMARTAPPVERAAWWRASTIRWLVPLTAGAAAVALWIALPPQRNEADKFSQLQPATEARAKADDKTATPSTAPPPFSASARRESPPAARTAPPAASQPKLESSRDDAGLRKAAPPPNGAPAAAAEPMATAAQAPAADAMTMQRRAFTDRIPVVIASPDPNVRWQTTSDPGVVQRTIDGGQTWTSQATGLAATLTAGFAPSTTVCWLVGRGGIVLLTTDGATWSRVASPDGSDLTGVRAAGDKTATVTTATGRVFSTSDGGQTWAERRPQDFPAAPF